MKMLGHHHLSDDDTIVAAANLLQNFQKQTAAAIGAQ
jgi:hypothetical protein